MSVYAPESENAVVQCLIRERVPSVPALLDALREIDWQQVRETTQAVTEDCTKRVFDQMATLESYLEMKGTAPPDPEEMDGGGNGSG